MIRRPPRSTQSRASAASDVYKRQGDHPRTMGGDLPEQLDHHPLGDAVRLALVLFDQMRHTGCYTGVGAEPLGHQALVTQMMGPRTASIPDARSVDEGEVARMAAIEERGLDGGPDLFGPAAEAEPAHTQRGAVRDACHRLCCRDDLCHGYLPPRSVVVTVGSPAPPERRRRSTR